MSCYGFFSVTVPRMYPFNPRLNFRVAYCLKLSGNWPLLYMKVMKVTKWQLKSRKLCTSCVYPHRYRKLIKPSRRIICFWFITLRPTYKDTDTLEEHWAMRYFEKWQEEREQDIRNVFNMLYFYDFRSESVCKLKTVFSTNGSMLIWGQRSVIWSFLTFLIKVSNKSLCSNNTVNDFSRINVSILTREDYPLFNHVAGKLLRI